MAVKLMVFDLDGCLVNNDKAINFAMEKICMEIYQLPKKEAMNNAWNAYATHGCTFSAYASENDLDQTWVEDMYAKVANEYALVMNQYLNPCGVLKAQLEQLKENGWTLAVLTQGRKDYAHNNLAYMEIEGQFPHHLVMGRDCVGNASKRTPEPYLKLLDRIPAASKENLKELVMVEDSPDNLPPAAKLGFKTALVGPKKPKKWVNWRAPDIQTLLAENFVQA